MTATTTAESVFTSAALRLCAIWLCLAAVPVEQSLTSTIHLLAITTDDYDFADNHNSNSNNNYQTNGTTTTHQNAQQPQNMKKCQGSPHEHIKW